MINKVQGLWKIGNTTFNWESARSQFYYTSLLEALQIFNSTIRKSLPFDKKTQEEFFDFCQSNTEYKILARNISMKKGAVRKKMASLKSYNFVDSNCYLTTFGSLFIAESNDEQLKMYSEKIVNNSNLNEKSLAMISGSISKAINNKDNGKVFYPWKILIDLLIEGKDILKESLFAARYASDEIEFKKVLSFNTVEELNKYLLNEVISSKFNDEKILKNRKSQKNVENGEKELMDIIDILKYSANLNNDIKISKSKVNIIGGIYPNIFKQIVDFRLFEKFKHLSSLEILIKARYLMLWKENSYMQQIRIYSSISKLFSIKNNKIVATKNVKLLRTVDVNEIQTDEDCIFKLFSTDKKVEYDENRANNIMFNILEKNNIIEHLMSDDFIKMSDLYPEEIRSQKKYVLLEYFTSLYLSKIFNIDHKKINSCSLDNEGFPTSHAKGGQADIVIDKHNYIFEVTKSFGRSTEKLELEPVPRHSFEVSKRKGKQFKTVFIAESPINTNIYSQFIGYRYNNYYYNDTNEGKNISIMSLTIDEFSLLIEKDSLAFSNFLNGLDKLDLEQSNLMKEGKWDRENYDNKRRELIQNI